MTADEKITFEGTVADNGDITLPRRFKSDVARLFSGREIVLTVERKRKKRSLNQNAYYWAVVIQMIYEAMNDAGDNVTIKEVHEFLKFRFLRIQKVDQNTGVLLYEYSRSTSALKTFEFSIYVDQCIQFAATFLGITIPLPYTQIETYSFPEHQSAKESRQEYLERIFGYVAEIDQRPKLKMYFRQNPDWQKDDDVRNLFNLRWSQLN